VDYVVPYILKLTSYHSLYYNIVKSKPVVLYTQSKSTDKVISTVARDMTEDCSLPLAIRCHFNFRNYSNEYEQNITQHHVWSVPTRSIRRSVLYGNLWRGNEQGDVIFKPPHDKYPNLFPVFGGIGTPMTPVKCTSYQLLTRPATCRWRGKDSGPSRFANSIYMYILCTVQVARKLPHWMIPCILITLHMWQV
jgi:hypothetical protein